MQANISIDISKLILQLSPLGKAKENFY